MEVLVSACQRASRKFLPPEETAVRTKCPRKTGVQRLPIGKNSWKTLQCPKEGWHGGLRLG